MKNEEYKKCQLKNLQKQQEDMKVAMLVFTKCALSLLKQTVQLRETDCFVKGNRLLYTLKHPLLK